MMESKILIVDDDSALLDSLRYNLLKENYTVVTAVHGLQALEIARTENPDLIILDIILPKLSGLEVCRALRKEISTPILILTGRLEESDKVVALELGADDYMTKPFSLRELFSRIRAILRRAEMMKQEVLAKQETVPQPIRIANLTIDVRCHRVFRNETIVRLTPMEFQLLLFLVRHRGEVFSRDQLLEKVWGYDCAVETRTVDFHIRSLRRKIEDDPSCPVHLVTLHRLGYKFEG